MKYKQPHSGFEPDSDNPFSKLITITCHMPPIYCIKYSYLIQIIWPINGIITAITTPNQSGSGSNGNESELQTLQSRTRTGAPSSAKGYSQGCRCVSLNDIPFISYIYAFHLTGIIFQIIVFLSQKEL